MNYQDVTIRIPAVPTRDVSPNGRAHWGKRHRAVKQLRNATTWSLRPVGSVKYPELPWKVDYIVAWGYRQKSWDDDNLISGLKPIRDSIAEDAGIDDRHISTGSVTQIRDPQRLGYVEVTIRGGKPQ